jgi:hypothetical protein
MYHTPETLSNLDFEDLRKPKAPNSRLFVCTQFDQNKKLDYLYVPSLVKNGETWHGVMFWPYLLKVKNSEDYEKV